MAKKGVRIHIEMESEETGHRYHTFKNKQNTTERLKVKKYDPIARKHVEYSEKK